jgi:hypothetical protein
MKTICRRGLLLMPVAWLLLTLASGQADWGEIFAWAGQDDTPTAVGLGLIGPPNVSSSLAPFVAVTDTGTVYVLWTRPGQANAPPPADVPRIPNELHPDTIEQIFRQNVAIAVRRQGKWSKPGFLFDGPRDCRLGLAWCEGEQLHLFLASRKFDWVRHLRFDSDSGIWSRQPDPPVTPLPDTVRQVGSVLHFVCRRDRQFCYGSFDGKRWSEPVRIEESVNPTTRQDKAALAIDRDGTTHVAWWVPSPNKGRHGYATIRDGKVQIESLPFETAPIQQDKFDVGIDPDGKAFLAYQADRPDGHPDALKVHVRRWDGGQWAEAEKISSPAEFLLGEVRIVYSGHRALITWRARETIRVGSGSGVLAYPMQRVVVTDGRSWSEPRFLARGDAQLPRLTGYPVGPSSFSLYVDSRGDVHAAWGSPEPYHCVAARLGNAAKKR